jgi:hypothetical protein
MNIYEKEINSNLILTIEHFTFYKKNKIYVLYRKRKKENKQMVKKRIYTHLLYTCKYFQIIYF